MFRTKRAGIQAIAGQAIAGFVALASLSQPSLAAEWPTKTVTILVATAAGGNTDLMARLGADYLTKKTGKSFVVENRPSAGGVITTTQVGAAAPDGYTLMFAPAAVALLSPLVQKLPVDPEQVLVPITNVGTGAQIIAIKRSLPVKSLNEFFEYARANPGKLNFVIAGANNLSHIVPIMLFKKANVNVVMVPTRGETDAITSVTSGFSDFYFGNASILLQYADHESIRLLAVGTAQRIPAAPDLPTVAETVPGFQMSSWNGFFAPKGTPEEILQVIRSAIAEMDAQPEMKEKLGKLGIIPGGQTREEVQATFDRDRAAFAAGVATAGIERQ
ncbi:MAG: extra-cytoplasmic solute receptor protein [Hyphomicrobiales bacterium]|nr:extra-cytoplasmic solute receptor protein [Hyphomicrobiales bacterium]